MAIVEKIRSILRPLPEPEVIIPAPQMSYAIRPLTINHLSEVVSLNLRCFENGDYYNKSTFNFLLSDPATLAYRVVTSSEKMVGFIVLTVGKEDNFGHITTIGVAPEHRRRRLAEKMLFHAENALRKRRVSAITLEVRLSNTAAQKLYQQREYYITQRVAGYYTNGEDGLVMVKSLA